MNRRFMDLVSVSYDVDTSGLEQRLDEIEQKLDGLDGQDGERLTEDRVQELVAAKVEEYISDESLMSHSAVTDTVEEYIKDGGYLTGDDIDEAVDNKLAESDFVTSSDVRDIVDEYGPDTDDIVDRVIASMPDNEDVERLDQRVSTLAHGFEQRLDKLEVLDMSVLDHNYAELASALQTLTNEYRHDQHKLAELEAQVETQARLLDEYLRESREARSFFDLLAQAVQILVRNLR